ncbi:MAG TPA: DMT family transporter [Xanthobacteraceae bacterium]|nr:DMT family transporter [Xanthobacteraceae bacterium]
MSTQRLSVPPPPGPIARQDDFGRAVLYMIFAMTLIPMLNASAKYLAADYPILQIVWARYAGHFFYMIAAFGPRRGASLLVSSQPGMQVLRSTLLCLSTAIYMTALRYIPLTTAAAISFTGPFMVAGMAPLLLGERVGMMRWLAIGVGFLGALLVIRPGFGAVDAAAFLVFFSALFSALYQIMTRKLAAHDRAETSITYIALSGFVLTSIPLPFVWTTPATPLDWALFVGLGFFGGFGHYFLVRAFELAPAPFISPFNYGQIVGAAILGFLVFGQFPDLWVWLGSAVIAGSGLFILYWERRRKPSAPART